MAWLKTTGIVMVTAMGAVSWGDAKAQTLPDAQPQAAIIAATTGAIAASARFQDGRNATGSVPAGLDLTNTRPLLPGNGAGTFDPRPPLSAAVRDTASAGARTDAARTSKKGPAQRAAVPEPGTLAMIGVGLLPLLSFRRSRR